MPGDDHVEKARESLESIEDAIAHAVALLQQRADLMRQIEANQRRIDELGGRP
jgi:hypothetical protein